MKRGISYAPWILHDSDVMMHELAGTIHIGNGGQSITPNNAIAGFILNEVDVIVEKY